MFYDVVGVNLSTGRVRFMAVNKTLGNAEAVVKMAVIRRGVEEEFFAKVPAGAYQDGETWNGRRDNTSPQVA